MRLEMSDGAIFKSAVENDEVVLRIKIDHLVEYFEVSSCGGVITNREKYAKYIAENIADIEDSEGPMIYIPLVKLIEWITDHGYVVGKDVDVSDFCKCPEWDD